MKRITLEQLMNALGNNPTEMAQVLGRKRQTVEYWIANNYTIEITDDNKIVVFAEDKSVHPVHEPQVRG